MVQSVAVSRIGDDPPGIAGVVVELALRSTCRRCRVVSAVMRSMTFTLRRPSSDFRVIQTDQFRDPMRPHVGNIGPTVTRRESL
jgi:hypothetical protein